MFIIGKNEELTPALLQEFINEFVLNEQPRLKKLKRYYKADNPAIKDKLIADPHKPNYKIAHSFASYITDTMTGYFMGSPVSYSSEDKRALETLKLIYAKNDEQSQNLRLERDASIYGIAYELLYVDKSKNIKFKDIDPRYSFVIHENTLEQEPLYFVRMYSARANNGLNWNVEVYDDKFRRDYEVVGNTVTGSLNFKQELVHGFDMVPVAIYNNNRDRMGDFERVTPMIDAYDAITSNTLNDLENFADAYLVFKDIDIPGDTPEEQAKELAAMRENRILQYNGDGDISWLTKDVMDGGAWEGSQAKLEEQIYYLSGCPNFNDESFGGNIAGVALKYKLLPLEQKTASKEREFRVGLQRRIQLMNQIVALLPGEHSYLDVDINFKRTLPVDVLNEMQVLQAGNGLLSQETLMAQLSFIEDPADEVKKLEEEQEKVIDFGFSYHEDDEDGNEEE